MIGKEIRFRHENKYLLTPAQEAILRFTVEGMLMPDVNAQRNGGKYQIHSLYFDDFSDSCLKDNLSGADPRAKFRIRYYNRNLDYIVLEKKIRRRGMGIKVSCTLDREECEQLIRGHIPSIRSDMPETKQKLLTEMLTRGLLPCVIVDYQRIPYVYPGGNVRVTFDRNLSVSMELHRFLNCDYHTQPIMTEGQCVLEVKWDELLPQHIKELVQPEQLTWTAFSKYTLCRINSL